LGACGPTADPAIGLRVGQFLGGRNRKSEWTSKERDRKYRELDTVAERAYRLSEFGPAASYHMSHHKNCAMHIHLRHDPAISPPRYHFFVGVAVMLYTFRCGA
jgi:hypothetical protein